MKKKGLGCVRRWRAYFLALLTPHYASLSSFASLSSSSSQLIVFSCPAAVLAILHCCGTILYLPPLITTSHLPLVCVFCFTFWQFLAFARRFLVASRCFLSSFRRLLMPISSYDFYMGFLLAWTSERSLPKWSLLGSGGRSDFVS